MAYSLHCWFFFFLLICVLGEDEEMEHQEEGREQLSETEGSGDDEPGSDHSEATQKKITWITALSNSMKL